MKPILNEINRRNLFRYLGKGALMYPFLRTLSETQAFGANGQKRAIFFYFPSGIVHKHFQPSTMGPSFDLPLSVQPLQKVKSDIVMVTNVDYKCGTGHESGAAYCMTGGSPAGGSIDTFLGEKMKANVRLPALRLGIASLYNTGTDSRMSYLPGGAPAPMEDNPKKAFAQIFGSSLTGASLLDPNDPAAADKSVLDFCLEDVKSLQTRLGSIEKEKLSIHLESIRELERRIQISQMPKPSQPNPTPGNPGSGGGGTCNKDIAFNNLQIPEDGNQATSYVHKEKNFGFIADVQLELLVQALACGVTNVAFLQYSHKDAPLAMDFEGGAGLSIGQHTASHHGDNAMDQMRFAQIQTYFMGQYAKLIERLKSVTEGDKSLLYNSLAVAFSEIGESNYHTMQNVACVLAGQAGGLVKTGRAIDAASAAYNQVLVSMIQAMGFNDQSFGSAGGAGALPGLLG